MIPEKYIELLKIISLCNSKTERKTLSTILCRHKKFIKAMKIICKNTVNEKIPLTERQQNQLRKHASVISNIANSRRSAKKSIVQSGGGFVSILLPIVASLIGSAINGARSQMGDGASRIREGNQREQPHHEKLE